MLELHNEVKEQKIIEILFNKENKSPIKLVDQQSNKISLDQVFAVEYEEEVYCIMVPLNKIEGAEDGIGYVFKVEENTLKMEMDIKKKMRVFDDYYLTIKEESFKKGA